MITIPTTELIGGFADVLPIIRDPKNDLAGVKLEWTGEDLRFSTYDIYAGAEVEWTPGEGAEGKDVVETEGSDDGYEPEWGGDDLPWRTWIRYEQAKEIVKVFKLPAKLWRFPVAVKCSPTGDRLIIEREDGPRVGRTLMVQAEPAQLAKVPNVRTYVEDHDQTRTDTSALLIDADRLGSFGTVRPHGLMRMVFGQENDPINVTVGSRFSGFVYPATAKSVPRFNLLRDGADVHVTREADEATQPF